MVTVLEGDVIEGRRIAEIDPDFFSFRRDRIERLVLPGQDVCRTLQRERFVQAAAAKGGQLGDALDPVTDQVRRLDHLCGCNVVIPAPDLDAPSRDELFVELVIGLQRLLQLAGLVGAAHVFAE